MTIPARGRMANCHQARRQPCDRGPRASMRGPRRPRPLAHDLRLRYPRAWCGSQAGGRLPGSPRLRAGRPRRAPGGALGDAARGAWPIAAQRHCRLPAEPVSASQPSVPPAARWAGGHATAAESAHPRGGLASHRKCTRSAATMPTCPRSATAVPWALSAAANRWTAPRSPAPASGSIPTCARRRVGRCQRLGAGRIAAGRHCRPGRASLAAPSRPPARGAVSGGQATAGAGVGIGAALAGVLVRH
jgi:hypothetical protein